MSLALVGRPKRAAHNLFIDRGELLASTRKETHNPRVTMFDGWRLRRAQTDFPALARQTVETFGLCPVSARRPGAVRKMLLDEWYLRLNRQLNIREPRLFSAIAGHASQNPSAAFLVHQAARSIDRVNDDAPDCLGFGKTARQHDLTLWQSFGNQNNRSQRSNLALEEINQLFLADSINLIDRIAGFLPGHRGKRLQRRTFTGF